MKIKLFTFIIAISSFLSSNALDLIVDQTGTGGAFTTLSAAVAASSPNDRIVVYNGSFPYQEDFSINHNLQLIPAIEGVLWDLVGTVTINLDNTLPASSEITISGAHIISGNIVHQFAGVDCFVNIVACTLDAGFINFDATGYYLHVADNTINDGYVYLRQGKVVGNYINNNSNQTQSVFVGNNNVASNEYVYIVGNHIVTSSLSYYYGLWAIYFSSTNNYAYIANNYIETNSTTYVSGIRIYQNKTGSGVNIIANNTIQNQVSNMWMVYVDAYNSMVEVVNNVIIGSGVYGFYAPAPQLNNLLAFNYVDNTIANPSTGFYSNNTNDFTGLNTIDVASGQLLTGPAINGGNPSASWMDLDFSVNDAGCYGGSYTKANFNATSTGARATFMIAPRRVVSGGIINVSGDGFDY